MIIQEQGVFVFFGIILTAFIAAISTLTQLIPFAPFTVGHHTHPIEPALIAMLAGILINQITSIHQQWQSGIRWTQKKILAFAIILLGSQLDLAILSQFHWINLALLLIAPLCVFFISFTLGRLLHLDKTTTALVAIGTAICGSSAIAAATPTVNAKQHQTSAAVSCINLLGLLAIIVFPLIGKLLTMNNYQFGLWAGISIQAVPQVVAAGLAYSPVAAQIATTTKLLRVCLLGPYLLLLHFFYHPSNSKSAKISWNKLLPPFIIGFFVLSAMRSLHFLPDFNIANLHIQTIQGLGYCSHFLMTMALAAIGLNTQFTDIKKSGKKTFIVAFFSAISLALISGTALLLLS
jgi:uncharacterized integral membrane protein (TIGR00698 family)